MRLQGSQERETKDFAMGRDPRPKTFNQRTWPRFVTLVGIAALSVVAVAAVMRAQLLWAISVLSGAVGRRLSVGIMRQPRLRFTEQGTFHITVFNDLHLGEGEDNRTLVQLE
jgi:hypothetical protein